AYENFLIYKEKTKKIHDAKIKNQEFHVGDRVLLFNSKLKIFSGKLKSRWSGSFTVSKVFPYGTVELSELNGPNFKVAAGPIRGRHVSWERQRFSTRSGVSGGRMRYEDIRSSGRGYVASRGWWIRIQLPMMSTRKGWI
nr:reverse transcriptase domain-containing protein [Tanacetum cinerariifolium]